MKFTVRKIQTEKVRVQNKWWRMLVRFAGPRTSIFIFLAIFLTGVFFVGSWAVHTFVSGPSHGLFSFGPLKKDAFGHTNILILGVAGEKKPGGILTDSILIASFYPKNASLSLLSIPRDTFVSSRVGSRKINEVYPVAKKNYDDLEALEVTKQSLSKFFSIDIHYGLVVDFNVFQEIVDALGGVDVFVEQEIVDPFYPTENFGYETFVVRKGLQTFDGATALKYVRSRKTSSDYDRAKRQQSLLLAVKEKAVKIRLLSDFDQLKEFYGLFRKYVNTDLDIPEIIAFAKFAVGIDFDRVYTAILNNDPTKRGGYLHSPAQEQYGGQFVLIPEDQKEMQLFAELTLLHHDVLLENAQISLFNGSKKEGLAMSLGNRLRRLGFHVLEVSNYNSEEVVPQTFVQVFSDKPDQTIRFLQKFIGFSSAQVERIISDESISRFRSQNPSFDPLIDLQIVLGEK